MNVNLQYDLEFLGAIYFQDCLQLNSYSVSMSLLTASKDAVVTNVAMERLRTFINSELENVVFINREHESQAELLQALGCNICTLPEEPVDQIIGMMLYCKLNAIMEGQLIVTSLDIQSSLGDSVWYQHSNEDGLGPFAADGWWHKNNTQKETLDPEGTPENVVKVQAVGWNEYGLDWPDVKTDQSAKVVDFRRHENK